MTPPPTHRASLRDVGRGDAGSGIVNVHLTVGHRVALRNRCQLRRYRGAQVYSYQRPCARKPVGETLRLLYEHGIPLSRQLVRAEHTAQVADRGLEDTRIRSFQRLFANPEGKEKTDLAVLPEWSWVKSTVATWLTDCSKISYTL